MLEFLNQTSPKTVKADVCIAGAGPAGIVLALTLAKAGISSVLLEGGGLDLAGISDLELYKGESTGIPYPLMASRLRHFGGTSASWGGWCKPLEPEAFGSRANAILPSWPISFGELLPHYANALRWCEIDNDDFDAGSSVEDASKHLLFGKGMAFTQELLRFSPPTRFGTRYRKDIDGNQEIRCFCHANLVSLKHQGDRIVSARAMNLDGNGLEIRADHFVLAMGGLENARFLLHTRDDNGIPFGNNFGLLGQCFMDQFGFSPGYMTAPAGLKLYRHRAGEADILPVVTASAAFQKDNALPSVCLMASPHSASRNYPSGYFMNPGILDDDVVEPTRYRLQMMCEPGIHRESYVALSDERDELGMKRVKLNWYLSDDDYKGAERFTDLLTKELGTTGLGRMQRTGYFVGERRRQLSVTWHHNGTTRMSESPQYGVVDPHCGVHGRSNLHIASSSVFPRSGYSNPTLAILALTDRLADSLAQRG